MQVKKMDVSDTEITLAINASATELDGVKTATLKRLAGQVKLAGFREGKAPLALIEKNLDPSQLQSEFLNDAVNQLYGAALEQYAVRPVDQPKVNIIKFVPFSTLEFTADLAIVGDVKLPDYKKIKKSKKSVSVTDKDVTDVVTDLQKRVAQKSDVDRAAKNGDEVRIDFQGTGSKGEKVQGADGKDFPIIIGSNTFIPGFEPNLIGMKASEQKTFTVPFPKDYGVKALAGKKVTFQVTVKKVQEVIEPKADDEFAASAGPFKTMAELKADIKKQLVVERQNEADRAYENELIQEITAKSKVSAPQVLIDRQVERMLKELRQNLTYRGQTYQEFLEAQGTTEEKYLKEVLQPQAELRVKAGLVLSEIAEAEKLEITKADLDNRLQALKAQYQDAAMQTELDKPEARNEVASRIITEKTITKLVAYSSTK